MSGTEHDQSLSSPVSKPSLKEMPFKKAFLVCLPVMGSALSPDGPQVILAFSSHSPSHGGGDPSVDLIQYGKGVGPLQGCCDVSREEVQSEKTCWRQ